MWRMHQSMNFNYEWQLAMIEDDAKELEIWIRSTDSSFNHMLVRMDEITRMKALNWKDFEEFYT